MNVEERVITVLNELYGSGYLYKPETIIINVSGIDNAEVVMALEEEFKIEILDKDAEKLSTLKDVAEYLTEKTKKEE